MNSTMTLSAKNRTEYLQRMSEQQLDLLVIGGGITGAGIALDASARGLSVGVIDKQDFGAGTSSRSTKLIHGGLRYLKQGDVRLVQEVGKERTILYKNAPHLVIPDKMLLPIVQGGTYGWLASSIGLYIYDWLAGVHRKERRIMLSRAKAEQCEPMLRKERLKGGGLYYEYRTDDARLTVEVMKTAAKQGALCVNYTEALEFIYDSSKQVIGIRAKDSIHGDEYAIYAKKVVNAAGPWVDRLRKKDESLYGKRLHLTKGVHLVLPYKRLPLKQSVYFDVAGGRMIFAIPRGKSTYIGTTDTNYEGVLEEPRVNKEEVAYLLQAVNDMFPSAKLTEEDITSSWAGLRPLIHEDGKSPSELSRKDETIVSPTGLITIAGGKLTGFRKMAERIVDLVAHELAAKEGRVFKPCTTDQIMLSGGSFEHAKQIPAYIKELHAQYKETGISLPHLEELVYRYGSNTGRILELARRTRTDKSEIEYIVLLAELDYAIHEEMATNLNDFFIRRTSKLFFDRPSIAGAYHPIAEAMQNEFGWSAAEAETYMVQFEKEYNSAIVFG